MGLPVTRRSANSLDARGPSPHSARRGLVGAWLGVLEEGDEIESGIGLHEPESEGGARRAGTVCALAQVLGPGVDDGGQPVEAGTPFEPVEIAEAESFEFSLGHAANSKANRYRVQDPGSDSQVTRPGRARYCSSVDIVTTRKLRLAQAEQEAGGIAQLAELAGLSEKYLRQIKQGFQGKKDRKPRSLGNSAARKIERALGKPFGWMDQPPVGPEGTNHNHPPRNSPQVQISDTLPDFLTQVHDEPDLPWSDVLPVPILDVGADSGTHALAAQTAVAGAMLLSREWIARNLPAVQFPDLLAALPATSDSMFPTFTPGDVLLVDRGAESIKTDGIYAFLYQQEFFVKRIQRQLTGGLLMISDNDRYAPQPISAEDAPNLQVQGRVVWAWNGKRL